MAISTLFPSSRPPLTLDFAKSKKLDPRITFARASTATFTGADGYIKTAASNVARFDHNPITGECLGLLVEEQRSNLHIHSQKFDETATWRFLTEFSYGTVNTAALTAPDGTQTANLITNIKNDNNFNFTFQNVANSTKGTYTYSVFLKDNNLGEIDLIVGTESYGANSNYVRMRYNFSTKVSTITGYVGLSDWITSSGAIEYPNGWVRLFLSFNTTSFAVQTNLSMGFYLGTAGNTSSFFNKSFYAWGSQLEAGPFPTSYIPTTTASVTRSADDPIIFATQFNTFYNQNQGTLSGNFINNNVATITSDPYIASITSSASTSLRMPMRIGVGAGVTRGTLRFFAFTDNFTYATDIGVYSSGNGKSIMSYKDVNDFAATFNGLSPGIDNVGSLTSVTFDRLRIGTNSGGGEIFNGVISKIAYYPSRLSNAQLQNLTR